MADQNQTAEHSNKGGKPHKVEEEQQLTAQERHVTDYAIAAATAAARVQTEEITARTRHTVHTEIQSAFLAYTKLTLGRRVIMAVGAVAAFGAGFLIKGWLTQRDDTMESNGVHD